MANIINLKYYTDALRRTGYKNTESAIAEIVDNSIEAKAEDVLIICNIDAKSGKKKVNEIAILDNGSGMDEKVLEGCLSIGESTRRAKKGMGRFGVGLPQASLHVAPRVEVYSWKNPDDVSMVYLDVEEIRNGKQENITTPKKSGIPKCYEKFFSNYEIKNRKMLFNNSGTLVIWKNCDRLNPKTIQPLFDRFKKLLGRIFRHFITNNKCYLGLTISNTDVFDDLIRPNDPLHIMKDNVALGDIEKPKNHKVDGEPFFELWENGDVLGHVEIPIKYYDKEETLQKSTAVATFSLAKFPFQNAGGESKVGKHCKSNVGISIVRADREIDFGKFDFFEDVNEPQHRWWGCEIKFEPALDDFFGVANNKQHVELFEIDQTEYSEDEITPAWVQLEKIIRGEIKEMYKVLKSRKKDTRNKNVTVTSVENIVTTIEEGNTANTSSKSAKKDHSDAELRKIVADKLKDSGNPNPSATEVKEAMEPVVKLEYKDLGDNSTFMDITTRMGNCWLTINTGSIFHRNLYSKIQEKDEDVIRAFNLILMAFARAEDESYTDRNLFESFKDVREKWGSKLRKYLNSDYQA